MGPTRHRRDWLRKPIQSVAHIFHRFSRISSLLVIVLVLCVVLFIRELPDNTPFAPAVGVKKPHFDGPHVDHPITILTQNAKAEFDEVLKRQSTSLETAVAEYKRRYGIDPPPHFDKWYEFATEHHVPLIDEYDAILELLHPFWGLSPAAVRRNVKNALGADPFLIGFFIRDGKIKATARGEEWKTNAIRTSFEPFTQWLPDMDLAFNSHDEARVVMAFDQLAQLNDRGARARAEHSSKRNSWNTRPADVNSGSLEETIITPFMDYAHRFTWSVGTLSCPPDSPARVAAYEDIHGMDDLSAYEHLPIGFVSNRTAFTDVCLTPSLSEKHGFFNMPNSWSVTHDPVPVFSPSKVSSFHDILYPAPWYLGNRVAYDQTQDPSWQEKKDVLYWRGSTTSGFSRGGVWHRQERQRFVEAVERPGSALKLEREGTTGEWTPTQVSRATYTDLFDVHFSHIGQCSEEDCDEQTRYFLIQPKADYEANWKNKYLLDIDGNAFSGRFYTFLQSHSLTLKQAMFREWHENRVMPWVHYLPLGLNGTDHIEMMRFLTEEDEGQQLGQSMAEESRKWAYASLRQVDMQAWMFRLLLEYGRVVDDNRHELGFRMP